MSIALCVLLFCGQIQPIDLSVTWKKSYYEFGQFSYSYEFSESPDTFCKILVRRDGTGIRIEACLKDKKGNAYGVWAQMIKAKNETGQTLIIFFRDSYDRKLREDSIPIYKTFWAFIPDKQIQMFLSNYPENNNGLAEIYVVPNELNAQGK